MSFIGKIEHTDQAFFSVGSLHYADDLANPHRDLVVLQRD